MARQSFPSLAKTSDSTSPTQKRPTQRHPTQGSPMTFPCLTTSWDDGHPLDFRIADLLSKYGLTGTFYIPRHCQTPTIPEIQVRELSRYFDIGAHTMHHVFLDACNDATAQQEIEQSKQWVEQLT